MKFHEFKTSKLYTLDELYETGQHKKAALIKKMTPKEFLNHISPHIITAYAPALDKIYSAAAKLGDPLAAVEDDAVVYALAATGIRYIINTIAELDWFDNNRPFYNVYPIVEKLVRNTTLDIPITQLKFSESVMCFRFPKGQEPLGIKTALLQLNFDTPNAHFFDTHLEPITGTTVADRLLAAGNYEVVGAIDRFIVQMPKNLDDKISVELSAEETLHAFARGAARAAGHSERVADQVSEDLPMYQQRLYFLLRLAVLVSLVEAGNDLITPAVLASEQEKYDTETSEAAKLWLEARAAKIQGRGFDFGKKLQAQSDLSPHWRNPHMALYWTGAGRTEPKLKLRAGSVVIPKHLSQVPTGYDCPVTDGVAAEKEEYVYLLQDPSQGYIKIGKTKRSIEERQKESSTFVPGGLKLRGYIVTADCTELETRLHREWAHKRRENEFFELTDEDVQKIIADFGGVQQQIEITAN